LCNNQGTATGYSPNCKCDCADKYSGAKCENYFGDTTTTEAPEFVTTGAPTAAPTAAPDPLPAGATGNCRALGWEKPGQMKTTAQGGKVCASTYLNNACGTSGQAGVTYAQAKATCAQITGARMCLLFELKVVVADVHEFSQCDSLTSRMYYWSDTSSSDCNGAPGHHMVFAKDTVNYPKKCKKDDAFPYNTRICCADE